VRLEAAATVVLLLAAPATPADWHAELALGGSHSIGSTLKLEQDGFPPLELNAGWASRSFEAPLYYAWRVARWQGARGWSFRFIHHKVYLEAPTPEVERFSVSHGYNLLTLERGFAASGFELWAGLGLVIAHPESTVRQRTRPENRGGPFGGGYFVTGPTLAVAAARRLPLGSRVGLVVEGRFTWARARVPIADGEASVPNTAVHGLVGLEVRF
jgi:hypothetical protein